MRPLNIGLSAEDRKGVIEILNGVLANESLLLIKTKKFHWDVTGPQFMTLHKLWDAQYEKLALQSDAVAERARALGGFPIGTARGFLEHASIEEHPGQVLAATDSVAVLVADHETVIRLLRQAVDTCDDKFKDKGTADFLTGLMESHEEMAWMLRSFIEGEPVKADGKGARPETVPSYA